LVKAVADKETAETNQKILEGYLQEGQKEISSLKSDLSHRSQDLERTKREKTSIMLAIQRFTNITLPLVANENFAVPPPQLHECEPPAKRARTEEPSTTDENVAHELFEVEGASVAEPKKVSKNASRKRRRVLQILPRNIRGKISQLSIQKGAQKAAPKDPR